MRVTGQEPVLLREGCPEASFIAWLAILIQDVPS